MDPKEMEFKQGNALHWASFLGSENAILYLTSYSDIDINQPDEVTQQIKIIIDFDRKEKKIINQAI